MFYIMYELFFVPFFPYSFVNIFPKNKQIFSIFCNKKKNRNCVSKANNLKVNLKALLLTALKHISIAIL
jgi:hypothetical protein